MGYRKRAIIHFLVWKKKREETEISEGPLRWLIAKVGAIKVWSGFLDSALHLQYCDQIPSISRTEFSLKTINLWIWYKCYTWLLLPSGVLNFQRKKRTWLIYLYRIDGKIVFQLEIIIICTQKIPHCLIFLKIGKGKLVAIINGKFQQCYLVFFPNSLEKLGNRPNRKEHVLNPHQKIGQSLEES